MVSLSFRRRVLTWVRPGMGLVLLSGAAFVRAGAETADAPPVLVSTTGGGPKWTTIDQLIAAASKGDPVACRQYAQLLEDGSPANGVARDQAKALSLYERAGKAGDGSALFRLGKIYAGGLAGVTVDQAKAFDYYLKSAQRGIAEAQYNVGAILVSARGVKRDYVEGLAWLLVASRHGADAAAGVTQVKKRLEKSPERIAAAEARAAALEAELAAATKSPAPPKRETAAAPAVTPTPPPPPAPTVEVTPIKPPAITVPPPKAP